MVARPRQPAAPAPPRRRRRRGRRRPKGPGQEGARQEGAGQEDAAKKAPAKNAAAKKAAAKLNRPRAGDYRRRAAPDCDDGRTEPTRRHARRRGLIASRSAAHELIGAGRVLVNGAIADKAARLVAPADNVTVAGPPARFVGRGGEKLDAALDRFGIDVTGQRYLDCGASTGGFTDCLPAARRGPRRRARRRPRPAPPGAARPTSGSRSSSARTSAPRPPTRSAGSSTASCATCRSSPSVAVIPALVPLCQPGGPDGAARQAPVRGGPGRGEQGPRRHHRSRGP